MHHSARAFAFLVHSFVFVAAVLAQDAGDFSPNREEPVASTTPAESLVQRADGLAHALVHDRQDAHGGAGDTAPLPTRSDPDDGRRLRGECLDHEGEPVADQDLLWGRNPARFEHAQRFLREGRTRTDSRGRFDLPLLDLLYDRGPSFDPDDPPPVAHESLVLRALLDDGRVLQWRSTFLHDPQAGSHDLGEMFPDESVHAVRVRVVDERGAACADTECVLRRGSAPGSSMSFADLRRGALSEEHVWFGVRSDRSIIRVRAQAPGYERTDWIEIGAGTDFREIRLRPAEPLCRVRGELLLPDHWTHVVGDGPHAPPGFYLERRDGGDPARVEEQLRFDAGTLGFSFRGLEPGEYRLGFDPDGFSPQASLMASSHDSQSADGFVPLTTFHLEGDELVLDPIDLRDRLHRVHVTVVDGEGRPFGERVELRASNDAGQRWNITLPGGMGEDGTTMHSLDGGVDLRVLADGVRDVVREDMRGTTRITLVEGGNEVRFRLERPAELPRSQREFEVRVGDESQTIRVEPPDAESLRRAGNRMR